MRNNCNVRIPKMHLHMIGAFKSCKDLNAPHRLHIWWTKIIIFYTGLVFPKSLSTQDFDFDATIFRFIFFGVAWCFWDGCPEA